MSRQRQSGLLSLDDVSLTEVAMFLSAQDLLHLALACRRFGRRVGTTTRARGSSFVEETARLQLLRRPATSRATVMDLRTAPGLGTCCWLSLLQEMEHLEAPLRFTRVGPRVLIQAGGLLVTRSGVTCHSGHRAAVISGHRMRAGCHFANFTLVSGGTSLVGFCPASFEPASGNGCHMDHWMLHVSAVVGSSSFANVCAVVG